jgi:hypothetical protein
MCSAPGPRSRTPARTSSRCSRRNAIRSRRVIESDTAPPVSTVATDETDARLGWAGGVGLGARHSLGLNYRLGGSSRGDRISVAVDDLPSVILSTKDRRAAKRDRSCLVAPTHLRLKAFELVDAGEFRREVLSETIEPDRSTISVVRGRAGHRVADLRPSALGRPERVRKSDVVALREKRLQRGWISASEGVDRSV